MTRLMGDATTGNVGTLLAVPGLEMVAPYVTGKGIAWTAGELAAAQFLPQAPIDQGGQGSPVLTATVRDVEPFAWTAQAAVDRTGWVAARPTIYCDRNDLPAVLAAGWHGDLGLAIPGWKVGDPLPDTPGCTVAFVQNDFSNPDYDLSVVLDPAWPLEDPMNGYVIPGINGQWLLPPDIKYDTSGNGFCMGYGMDGRIWMAKQPAGQPWGQPAPQ